MQFKKLATILIFGAADAFAEEPVRRVVVSIPDRKLALIEKGKVTRMYDVAVGKAKTPSPTGVFQVATLVPHPTWYKPGRVVPPGKSNPLGSRWIGLSRKGYGIHGTNEPRSIGKPASHGCIRMRKQDLEELFATVSVGDTVELVNELNEEQAMLFAGLTDAVTAGGGE